MRRIALIGAVAVCLGIAALVEDTLAGLVPLDGLVVTAVGALAILAGLRYAAAVRTRTVEPVTITAPEPRHRSAVLGEDVDATLRRSGRIGSARRVELRRRLQSVAVDALTRDGRSRETARQAIEHGTWTEDPVAAGYLAESRGLPRRWRARRLVRPRSTARRCVARSLDAIEEVRAS